MLWIPKGWLCTYKAGAQRRGPGFPAGCGVTLLRQHPMHSRGAVLTDLLGHSLSCGLNMRSDVSVSQTRVLLVSITALRS